MSRNPPEFNECTDGEPNSLVCARCGRPRGRLSWDALANAHRACPPRTGPRHTGRTEPVLIRLSPEDVVTLDSLRGPLSRGAYVQSLVRQAARALSRKRGS